MELQAKLRLKSDSYNTDPPYVVIKTEGDSTVIIIGGDREIEFNAKELKKVIELLSS